MYRLQGLQKEGFMGSPREQVEIRKIKGFRVSTGGVNAERPADFSSL